MGTRRRARDAALGNGLELGNLVPQLAVLLRAAWFGGRRWLRRGGGGRLVSSAAAKKGSQPSPAPGPATTPAAAQVQHLHELLRGGHVRGRQRRGWGRRVTHGGLLGWWRHGVAPLHLSPAAAAREHGLGVAFRGVCWLLVYCAFVVMFPPAALSLWWQRWVVGGWVSGDSTIEALGDGKGGGVLGKVKGQGDQCQRTPRHHHRQYEEAR